MIESLLPLLATLLGVLAFLAAGRLALAARASHDRRSRGPLPALLGPAVAVDRRRFGAPEATAPFERWLARARTVAPADPSARATDASTDRPRNAGETRRAVVATAPPSPSVGPRPACVAA